MFLQLVVLKTVLLKFNSSRIFYYGFARGVDTKLCVFRVVDTKLVTGYFECAVLTVVDKDG